MAEEKKPKIDLKARLGKKTVSTPGGSIPPPVGIGRGIPAPPFGGGAKPAARIDASDPYAALPADAAPVRAEPKAIKVEMSEEVVRAQKKGRSTIIALAVVAAGAGALLGFAGGSAKARSDADTVAIAAAAKLAKEVDAANAEIEKLADVLKSAKERLSASQFPDKELADLGAVNIPFGGLQISSEGRGIGRFKSDIVTGLLEFASGAEEANDQKESVQRLLVGSKKGISEFLADKTDPKVRWALFVENGPHGPWASMQLLPEPFAASKKEKDKDGKAYSWPEKFKLKDGDKTSDFDRYTKGDPVGNPPKIMPVDPRSQLGVCPSDVIVRLRREIGDLEDTLRGVRAGAEAGPEDEKKGLLELGTELKDKLARVGTPG